MIMIEKPSWSDRGPLPDVVFHYLLGHGRWFDSQLALARRPPKYQDKECFFNAERLSVDRRYTYCEGLALSTLSDSERTFWVHHAWVTDDQARVIDPTWRPTALAYFGVPIDGSTVAYCLDEGAWYGQFLEWLAKGWA